MTSPFDFEATRTLRFVPCLRCETPILSTREHPLCALCQPRPLSTPSTAAKPGRRKRAA